MSQGLTSLLPLPDVPLLAVGLRLVALVDPDGGFEELTPEAARQRLLADRVPPMVVHARSVARRLGLEFLPAFDLLELFAFVRPARFCLPTVRGLAAALELPEPAGLVEEAMALKDSAALLLAELRAGRDREVLAIVQKMAGWPWQSYVQSALSGVEPGGRALAVWRALPEIPESGPEEPPSHHPVDPAEARRQLARIVGDHAEPRPAQADYASAVAMAFQPREAPGVPRVVMAEAGTGVGKTLGYLAPASVWAERNGGSVWISTYTRNLQTQIDAELERVYPDPARKAERAVVRKGRENYLCLLNYEDLAQTAGNSPQAGAPAAAGLMARWVTATRDGDLTGGDLPGWLPDLLGRARTLGLADRRGECIFSACHHFDRCFVERSIRKARRAEIVVANHALVMVQGALGGGDDGSVPARLVFDEGHHVFDAADSAFSAHLSGMEGQEIRRWLLGAEGSFRSRARGLRRRIEELITDERMENDLLAILKMAKELPGDGWQERLAEDRPQGSFEQFLLLLRRQVLARQTGGDAAYSLECEVQPLDPAVTSAGQALKVTLDQIRTPADRLIKRLSDRLVDEADTLDTALRKRIDSMARSLERRLTLPVTGWVSMLAALEGGEDKDFVDWFGIDRDAGQEFDVGMHRHWLDPAKPFAKAVAAPAHGLVVTSATLTDRSSDTAADWQAAERRLGLPWLGLEAVRAQVVSPYNYPEQTRVYVVDDVRRDDMAQVAAAYRALFLASGGGGLGLFTAISRLKGVHGRIADDLADHEIPLYAQHVDPMETASLIDIFRGEEDACLLGTDAVRDGVDVPGRSLRLIVFDRVPWPRPTILHKARRNAFGGWNWDQRLVRLKLKQAFGRLVRRAGDHGVFVLLEPLPGQFRSAFPPGVAIERVGLAEAVRRTRDFIGSKR